MPADCAADSHTESDRPSACQRWYRRAGLWVHPAADYAFAEPNAGDTTADDHAGRAANDQPDDARSIRAERDANADFARTAHRTEADETVKRDGRQRQCHGSGQRRQRGDDSFANQRL